MSGRYVAVPGTASIIAIHTPEDRDGNVVRIEVSEQNIRDTRTGRVYEGGRRTVRCPGIRARSWNGECAWMDSERFAYDLVTAVQFGRDLASVR